MESESEEVELVLNNKGEDFPIIVDLATANILLNDPAKADEYITSLTSQNLQNLDNIIVDDMQSVVEPRVRQIENINDGASTSCPVAKIWTQKHPTETNINATEAFLTLKGKYDSKFSVKKTVKTKIWLKIAEEMHDMGFDVGTGKEASEKLRLKYSNLQKQYLNYIRHQNTTGESQRDPPPYFGLMHSILGNKDKTNPSNLQDSLVETKVNDDKPASDFQQLETEESCNMDNTEECGEKVKNRFRKNSDSVKPKSVNSQLLELTKIEVEERKRHFAKLESLLETQYEQRGRLLDQFDKLIEIQTRKRKRESISDSD